MSAQIELSNIDKHYGSFHALKGVSLSIEKGSFVALVGPSGCGKSTLLRSIAGLETITSGSLKIAGETMTGVPPRKRDVAMVFQSYALYPNMTVAGNIAFGMEMRGVPTQERQKAIDKVAKVLQIGHLLQRKPSKLSGGQRQRVAMGRALVRDPKLFLFDEPLSNLDAKLRVDMRIEIKRLHATTGTTIVYVTHDQIEAMTLATKIAVMRDGEVQQFGTPAEIYNNPTNLFVADFMGSPAMNLVPATIGGNGNALSVVLEREAREPISLPLPNAPAGLSAFHGKPIIFGVRPEALTDPEGAERNASNIATADCHIEVVEPAGSDTFAVTNLGGKAVVARLRADANIQPGTVTPLAFNLTKAVFFDPATENRIL
jgi:multiple sugar transport system ATP-binding protein